MTKRDAATKLGVSLKTIERYAKKRQIGRALRKRSDGKIVAIYDPTDVEKVKRDREAKLSVHLPAIPQHASAAVNPEGSRRDAPSKELLTAGLAPRISEKLLLTFDEALALSGLPKSRLGDALKSGTLRSVNCDGIQLIRRSDLDALIDRIFEA